MQIQILYFAALRDQRGLAAETVDLPAGTTARDAYAQLCPPAQLPVQYAVNRAVVSANTPLHDGDELAFLPPLGGG